MTILVAHASKYGATRHIAERIAETLRASGLAVETRPVKVASDPANFDAFVIGSAVYYDSWLKEAVSFVRRHQAVLASRPVWLFSSGPIGADTIDEHGQDVRQAAEPRELAEFRAALQPRDHRVFFGELDRHKLGLLDRLVVSLPAFPGTKGDFRDWGDVEAWAEGIARELTLSDGASRVAGSAHDGPHEPEPGAPAAVPGAGRREQCDARRMDVAPKIGGP